MPSGTANPSRTSSSKFLAGANIMLIQSHMYVILSWLTITSQVMMNIPMRLPRFRKSGNLKRNHYFYQYSTLNTRITKIPLQWIKGEIDRVVRVGSEVKPGATLNACLLWSILESENGVTNPTKSTNSQHSYWYPLRPWTIESNQVLKQYSRHKSCRDVFIPISRILKGYQTTSIRKT